MNFGLDRWLAVLVPAGLAALGLLAGFSIQRIVLGRLRRAAQKTESKYDDLILDALHGPVVLWFFILGLFVAASVADIPEKYGRLFGNFFTAVIIFSVTWVLSRMAGALVERFSVQTGNGLPKSSIFKIVARLLVLVVGFLVILQTLGISITPVLTALGVGGLAVALALQDTLSNLFAGLQILAARQVRVGDFVRLEGGEEGYIADINWRNTTIRTLPNNLVVVPNAKLASAILTDFNMPDSELAVLVPVGVGYDSDLEKVERVTAEVATRIMKTVPGGVPEFIPFIRYNKFDDFSINFTVILRGKEYVDQHLIRHEFIKALHKRYRGEGIEIPFPIRTVHMKTADGTVPSAERLSAGASRPKT